MKKTARKGTGKSVQTFVSAPKGATKLAVSPAGSTPPKGSLARLADSSNTTARWVGKDAFRELTSPAVVRRLEP